MSIHHINLALNTEYQPTTKILLLVLADYADETGECFPSWKKLMQRTSIKNRHTIARHLKIMEEDGVLTRERRFDTSNIYRLFIENAPSTENVPGISNDTRVVIPNDTRVVIPGSTLTTTKPSIKHQEKKPKKLSEFDNFLAQLKSACKYKTKVNKSKAGESIFKTIEDKKKLFKDYIEYQEDKKEFSVRITSYMEDYETVHNKQDNRTETDQWCRS